MLCTVAQYDGTDIGRPMIVDNSTGVPQYKYIEVEGYNTPSLSKRGATANWRGLWPGGIVYYQLQSSLSGYLFVWYSSIVVLQVIV